MDNIKILFIIIAISSLNALSKPLESKTAVSVIRLVEKSYNSEQNSYKIAGSKITSKKDAISISKIFEKPGVKPPNLLDIYDSQCAVVINDKAYYVLILDRGIQITQAKIKGDALIVTHDAKLVGKHPKISELLYSISSRIQKPQKKTDKSTSTKPAKLNQ